MGPLQLSRGVLPLRAPIMGIQGCAILGGWSNLAYRLHPKATRTKWVPSKEHAFFFHETLGFIHAPRRTRKTRHAFLHEKPFRYPYVDTGENDFFRVDVWIFKGLFVQKCMSNFPRSPRRVDRSKRFSAIIQRYYSALLFQRYYFRLFQRYYFRLFQRYFSAIFQRYFSAIIQRYFRQRQRTKDKGQRTFLVAGPILPTDYLQKLLVLNGSPPA